MFIRCLGISSALSICAMVFCSLLLVSVARHRSVARGASCSQNLMRIGLATKNYHASFKHLPMGCGGTRMGGIDEPRLGNASRLSPLVGLLPFMEQQALWEKISNPYQNKGMIFPAMGPVPWYDAESYKPWGQRPEPLVCPADAEAAQRFATAASYAINYGDGIRNVGAFLNKTTREQIEARGVQRGAFHAGRVLKFRDFLDGLSNTILLSERRIGAPKVAMNLDRALALDPSLCIAANENSATEFWPEGRNACWADGALLSIGFQTILPPNSPSASTTQGALEGVMSVSSNHLEGAHVLFADGAVKFATNSIDAGDPTLPSVAVPQIGDDGREMDVRRRTDLFMKFTRPGSGSPYGLWGALGTRASREKINLDDDHLTEPPMAVNDLTELEAKPLQTWTMANGETAYKARLLGIRRDGEAILFTEDGNRRSVRLSDLKSEDAYRAIEQLYEEKQQTQRMLIAQLQQGIGLLNQQKFDEFFRLFFESALSEQEIVDFASQSDVMIKQLEIAVRAFQSPSATVFVTEDETLETYRVRSRTPIRVDITFRRSGDGWKLVR